MHELIAHDEIERLRVWPALARVLQGVRERDEDIAVRVDAESGCSVG